MHRSPLTLLTYASQVGVALSLAMAFAFACTRSSPPQPTPISAATVDPIGHLRSFEGTRRTEAKFLETTPQNRAFGADPYDVAVMSDGSIAGILRGCDELAVLGDDLSEHHRIATPRSPSAVATYSGAPIGVLRPNDILVASEIDPIIAHYRINNTATINNATTKIERLADLKLDGVVGVRDIATGPEGVIYVIEEHDDRLITLAPAAGTRAERFERNERVVPRGPLRLARTRHALFVLSLLDHSISAFPTDSRGLVPKRGPPPSATAKIDGPYWGLDTIDLPDGDGDALLIAGGVEDHPLDRTGGFFGYVDSFVYAYRWIAKTGELIKTASINVGERGLIVPKAIALRATRTSARDAKDGKDGTVVIDALVTSYGGDAGLHLEWSDGFDAPPRLTVLAHPPGTSAVVATTKGFLEANPLLDAWIATTTNGSDVTRSATKIVHPECKVPDARDERERIGEALFFTGLMAPSSSSEGSKSRFSCETCHFEGYVDGRVHHTGRGDIHATTKPLVGLFNNRPHFSRALDPDLSSVAENEFRVAGAPSPSDPHFDLEPDKVPWLKELGVADPHQRRDAAELRLSLMAFLMKWTHRTNPRAIVGFSLTGSSSQRAFSDEERRGATLFRDRCERCHEARAAADDGPSRVSFDRWESLVLSESGPIVWASDKYEKTGVVPYVHDLGTRVPSLRRVYKKRPYFTNGSAPDIMSILRRARFTPSFSHDSSKEGEALDDGSARAIAAFVDLL